MQALLFIQEIENETLILQKFNFMDEVEFVQNNEINAGFSAIYKAVIN